YLYVFIYSTKYRKTILLTISFIIISLVYIIKKYTLELIILLDKIAILLADYNSYSISKLLWSIQIGMIDTSGRDELYEQAINMIKENDHFYPNGLGSFLNETGVTYPHNLFIEMYLTFGFVSI